MDKPLKHEPKKPYAAPKLTVYGTVRELTQRTGPTGGFDNNGGGMAGANRTVA